MGVIFVEQKLICHVLCTDVYVESQTLIKFDLTSCFVRVTLDLIRMRTNPLKPSCNYTECPVT